MAGYPQAKFRYKVEIDGLEAGGFSEVTGFDATIEPIEYREGDMTAETPMKILSSYLINNTKVEKNFFC